MTTLEIKRDLLAEAIETLADLRPGTAADLSRRAKDCVASARRRAASAVRDMMTAAAPVALVIGAVACLGLLAGAALVWHVVKTL